MFWKYTEFYHLVLVAVHENWKTQLEKNNKHLGVVSVVITSKTKGKKKNKTVLYILYEKQGIALLEEFRVYPRHENGVYGRSDLRNRNHLNKRRNLHMSAF